MKAQTSESAAITRSGKRIDLTAPDAKAIRARDVAEQLAKLPAYRGATEGFYSIAQHSFLVAAEMARAGDDLTALYGLLHHGAEAFVDASDRALAPLARAVHEAFGLPWPRPAPVTAALERAHAKVELAELRDLLAGRGPRIAELDRAGVERTKAAIRVLTWDRALERFLDAARAYSITAGLPVSPAMKSVR